MRYPVYAFVLCGLFASGSAPAQVTTTLPSHVKTTSGKKKTNTKPPAAKAAEKTQADAEGISYWPLTFVKLTAPAATVPATLKQDGTIGISGGADNPGTDPEPPFVKALNDVFGGSDIKAIGSTLAIKGTADKAFRVKELLAKFIDIPAPMVKIDVWTIQVNQSKSKNTFVQNKMRTIRDGVEIVRYFTQRHLRDLARLVESERVDPSYPKRHDYETAFTNAGLLLPDTRDDFGQPDTVDNHRKHPRSLAESLLFLGLSERSDLPNRIDAKFNDKLSAHRLIVELEASLKDRAAAPGLAPEQKQYLTDLHNLAAMLDQAGKDPIPLTKEVFSSNDRDSALFGILLFLNAWNNCNLGAKARIEPEVLAARSAAADMELKHAVGAFSQDMRSAFTAPLLRWVQGITASEGGASKLGIDLVGQTTINVTSREPGFVGGVAQGVYPYSAAAKPSEFFTNLTKTGGGTGLAHLGSLGGVLAAGLLSTPDTTFTHIAPGFSLGVTPSVLPDADSARLVMNFAETSQANGPNNETNNYDLISTQMLNTDVLVSAFDLLELSTVAAEHTSKGDVSWRIPVLENIPILGPMFRGPRRVETKHQEALAICNVTIIPRSVDLIRHYTRGSAG